MTKYRIVKRNNHQTYCYFAQKKVMWWWVDLPTHSCSSYGDFECCETPSHNLNLVEKYIEQVMFKNQDTVVKVYG